VTVVLIAQNSKANYLTKEEVITKQLPEAQIIKTDCGWDVLSITDQEKPDICLIHHELPDISGIALAELLRLSYTKPIILIGQPETESMDLQPDISSSVNRPITSVEELQAVLDEFATGYLRPLQRINTNISAKLNSKKESITGRLINLSLWGACFQTEQTSFLNKKGAETENTFDLEIITQNKPEFKHDRAAAIQASVSWNDHQSIGLHFQKMTSHQKRNLLKSLYQCVRA